MSKRKSLLVSLCVALPGLAASADDVAVLHSEPLLGYRAAASTDGAQPLPNGERQLSFTAFGRVFLLELEPNGRLAELEAKLDLPPGVAAYRGALAGRPGSWARIVSTPAGPAGLLFDGTTLYGLESPDDTAAAATGAVIFRLDDVYVAPGALACGTADATDGAHAVAALVDELAPLTAAAQGAAFNLDIGAVADFEFSQSFGSNAEAALLTRFNNVDGIFSEQVGVQITVRTATVFTSTTDPFTATSANALLDEVATYRTGTPSQTARGLTHLFTGRDLDGSTAGIAYIGALCSNRFGAGLSEARRGATLDSLVAAHEIGHNFGAPHDAESGSACQSTPATFLMAPAVTGSNQFSSCSIAQMQPEIASATCLTPIASTNIGVTTSPGSRDVLATVAFDQVFTVTSSGTSAVTNASATVAAENGLELLAASSSSGACTVSGQTATCALGTIGAGSARTIALNLRAAQLGTFAVTTTVAADGDASAGDNSASAAITAAPVVDLVLTSAAGNVAPNAQTTVTANVENTGDFGATGVAVTATLTAGVRADQASLGGAACTIASQTVTCAPRALSAHATVALSLTVTGLSSGDQQINVAATSIESERTPTNNQVGVTVTVAAPPSANSGGGGGGAMTWWAVLLLGAAQLGRRRESLAR